MKRGTGHRRGPPKRYSHSTVAGGLDVISVSYTHLFDAFNISERFTGGQPIAHFGKIDKYKAPEGILGEIGQTDFCSGFVGKENPFVGFGVLQIGWRFHKTDSFLDYLV